MGNSLNCLEQCRSHHESQQRLLVLQKGAVFKRNKYILGLKSGSEKIHLRLSTDEQTLMWKTHPSASTITRINTCDVNLIKLQGPAGFSIVSQSGDVLLDLEADTEELRNVWVTNMQLLCEDSADTEESTEANAAGSRFRKMVEDTAKKQQYWAQRTQDLEERKKQAEARKQKFAGAGMKYTALAMSNRPSSSES